MSGTSSNAAHGKARKGTKSQYTDKFQGFVDIPLTPKDMDALEVYTAPGQVPIVEFLEQLSDEGYKLSISPDAAHNCVIATATGKSDDNPNQGYALSARGPSAEAALAVLWYKMVVLCHGDNWTAQGSVGGSSRPIYG